MRRHYRFIIYIIVVILLGVGVAMQYLKQTSSNAPADDATAASSNGSATGNLPKSIAEGEDATRRHITDGIKAGDVDPETGRQILYYHDPMVPANRFDNPAKSPFMDMMLVPVYAGSNDSDDQNKVVISSRVQQNLGVRTAAVVEKVLSPQVSAVGNVAFNERDQAYVQTRATTYVEGLYVRATLDVVKKGQALAKVYVPEWVAAQEEFFAVRRMKGEGLGVLVDAARQRMRQVGMTNEQIRTIEKSGRVQREVTITSPINGVLTELAAREGVNVPAGATLFRINGLGRVWIDAEVPETQAALIRRGSQVQVRSAAAPHTILPARVQAIVPEINAQTRTLKVRIELANPNQSLVPGMSVNLQFTDTLTRRVLTIPTEAVIQTGRRVVVMLSEESGKFRPAEVELGIESNGHTEIKRGLNLGDRIVVSSQFLIDSEASLKGVEARLNEAPTATVDEEQP